MTTKTYDGQTARFIASVATCMPALSGEVMQGWIDNPQALKKFLRGLSPSKEKHAPDDVIRVDRSIRPAYPKWADPEWINDPGFIALEQTGPAEYPIGSLEQWLHDGQKNGGLERGHAIYEHLESNNMLVSCLGLTDLLAIQKLGVEVFRRYFADKAVFGWKSVVRHRDGDLDVPCLVGDVGEVVLDWHWLDYDWDGDSPVLRFAS